MGFQNYTEFFDIIWHTDSSGNKVSIQRLNEVHTIVNGKILLREIPDSLYNVTITSKYELDISETITSADYFKVDYLTGEVFFYSTLEGTSITIAQYYGRGLIKTFANRIELQDSNNRYTSTNVEDFADEITQRVNNLVLGTTSGTEVVDARASSVSGTTYSTLKSRIDTEYNNTVRKDATSSNLSGDLSFSNKFNITYNLSLNSLDFDYIG